MSDAPQTDREMLLRWEWFRRADWLTQSSLLTPTLKAFTEIVTEAEVSACVEINCGLGVNTVCLREHEVNIIGCDESAFAIDCARSLSSSSNPAFFNSAITDIKNNAPHEFDAALALDLLTEPDWQKLRDKFSGINNALRPGGFVVFNGPSTETPYFMAAVNAHKELPNEESIWTFKDGALSCSKLVLREDAAENYADEKIVFSIIEDNTPRLESTTCRIPGYWSWQLISDLTRQSGFSHHECRSFKIEGEEVLLNIAYKDGSIHSSHDHSESESAYYDF